MTWERMPPAMESVSMPDVPQWERDVDAGDEFYEYGLEEVGLLGGAPVDLHVASPFAGNRTDPADEAVDRPTTEQTDPADDYDQAALAGALR